MAAGWSSTARPLPLQNRKAGMILIDTGFLLALSQPSDALHERAVSWACVLNGPLCVTEYVLCETLNALSKRRDRPRGQRLIELIEADSRITLIGASTELFRAGLKLHRGRPDKDWSLTDCISFHIMIERGMTRALAHDEHFAQAGFEALLQVAPPKAEV